VNEDKLLYIKRIQSDDVIFHLDHVDIESNRLMFEGWIASDSAIKDISVFLNNEYQGKVSNGIVRTDVSKSYPNKINNFNVGFKFSKSIDNIKITGYNLLEIQIKLDNNETLGTILLIDVTNNPTKGNVYNSLVNNNLSESVNNVSDNIYPSRSIKHDEIIPNQNNKASSSDKNCESIVEEIISLRKYSIDFINNIPITNNDNIEIPKYNKFFVKGWVIDDLSNDIASEVFIGIDNQWYKAKYGCEIPSCQLFKIF